MRAALLVLALAGCSYDWDSVQPYYERDASTDGVVSADPRHVVLPGTSCNPISTDGCADSNYCFGMIEVDQTISSLTCYSHTGSSARGGFCEGPENCTPELLCWTNPNDASDSTCEEPCFSDEDCSSGTCDVAGGYRVTYGRATMYRCL
jgi:hypothetical protein